MSDEGSTGARVGRPGGAAAHGTPGGSSRTTRPVLLLSQPTSPEAPDLRRRGEDRGIVPVPYHVTS